MLERVELIAQSAIRIENNNGEIIYFDPFKLAEFDPHDADFIFITHPHYDHFSPDDILKIKKETTKIIAPQELEEEIKDLSFKEDDILLVSPNNYYGDDGIAFRTVPAYNINKDFHKKEYNWVGYLVRIDEKIIYVAGDTDNIEDAIGIRCDIAFVPVGGIYTMNWKEAAELIKTIKPEIAVPTHYKTIVGSMQDAYNFKEALNGFVEVDILM